MRCTGTMCAALAATIAQKTPCTHAPKARAPRNVEKSEDTAARPFEAASSNINVINSTLRGIQRFNPLDSRPLAAPIHAYSVTVNPTVEGD
ncbi:hypothetical protein N430_02255 [Pseudomonas sp. CC120222-01a]|nr:hypothetical protein N430_02255 [Pseudomonas sp. CC120222-01a]